MIRLDPNHRHSVLFQMATDIYLKMLERPDVDPYDPSIPVRAVQQADNLITAFQHTDAPLYECTN